MWNIIGSSPRLTFGHTLFKTAKRLVGYEWHPDAEFFDQFKGPYMYSSPEERDQHVKTYWNSFKPPTEIKVMNMQLNFGPAHPAAHGCLRMISYLEGEVVRRLDPHIGLLHRGSEKLMEYRTFTQAMPYFDRFDYLSPMNNEHPFILACENLLNVEVPLRGKFIRTLMAELNRIANHLAVLSFIALDVGAITPLFWLFEEREKIYEIFERATGARMHVAYFRIGGVHQDIPLGLLDDIYDLVRKLPERLDEIDDLCTGNRFFKERLFGIGRLTAHDAMNLGQTGVMLRSTGVKWDLRKTQPYEIYDRLCFDVPVGANGDCYDRFVMRVEETRQSVRMVQQIIEMMPCGEVKVDDAKISPPTRGEMKSSMEAVIHHFKLFSKGMDIPPGSTYAATEHPKGEMAVYLVSDGSARPYRVRVRAPSFIHLSAMDHLCRGGYLADAVATLASLDVVFGDIDR